MSRMVSQTVACGLLIGLILLLGELREARACPLCGPASPTLAEQMGGYEAVAVARFVGGEQPDREREFSGTTRYQVLDLLKAGGAVEKSTREITLPRYRHGEPDSMVLLMGRKVEEDFKWETVIDINPTIYQYLTDAPPATAPNQQRLSYFIRFLEHADPIIATDAYSEFAVAPYEDIVPLRVLMNPELLREWIGAPNDPPDRFVRVGLYGLMLGMSGAADDAKYLEQKVLNYVPDYQFGIDGMTGGYLLLSGEQGLKTLEQQLLSRSDVERDRLFPVLEAMRFMWTYSPDRVPQTALKRSMRVLLDRPDLADLVIIDLARWKDWEAMDRIVSYYGKEEFDVPAIKRAILRFLMSAQSTPAEKDDLQTARVIEKAQKHLNHFRETDPRTVKVAERYFFD